MLIRVGDHFWDYVRVWLYYGVCIVLVITDEHHQESGVHGQELLRSQFHRGQNSRADPGYYVPSVVP